MADPVHIRLHPRQKEAFVSPATEILYGGAAGGGKSYLLRASLLRWIFAVPGLQAYLFRRTLPDLEANHLRGSSNLLDMLAGLLDTGRCSYDKQKGLFQFQNGSALKLAHLQHEGELTKYHGAEIHVLGMDELTHFTEDQYRFLRSRVRLGGLEVPEQLKDLLPRIENATNPGSVGHAWVKRTWVTAARPGEVWTASPEEGGMRRVYIPARVDDNPTLTANDPGYIDRLLGLGTPELVRAMREGDWDIVAGQAFGGYSEERHVIRPFIVPPWWQKFRSFDWGSSKPFSVGWWCVSDGEPLVDDRVYPRGAVIRYREWYGAAGPDKGLGMTSSSVARGIVARESKDEVVGYSVCDPQCWAQHDGPSIAEKMAREGVYFRRTKHTGHRLNARVSGSDEFRARLEGIDGVPMAYVFDTCRDFIRTIPDLVTDPDNPEELAEGQEDHVYDETRYAFMSRPSVRDAAAGVGVRPDRWDRVFAPKETPSWRVA